MQARNNAGNLVRFSAEEESGILEQLNFVNVSDKQYI
jgi:hypothetical protein